MDISLAHTFLEVIRSGSFIGAAEQLHVTQTTVTTRIQNLEELLGCKLFVRNRSGAKLTENGQRFVIHASQLIQTWESARKDLPLPEGAVNIITIGGELSLWNPLLLSWVLRLRQELPNLAVRAEAGEARSLHQKLESGVLDAALVHQPNYWPGMQVEQILEEKLVLVRSVKNPEPYVYIDWGEDFRQQHDTALAEYAKAKVSLNLGPLALYFLLENGGSGYFRTRVVEQHIKNGALELVPQSPEFSYPVYLIYSRSKYNALMQEVLNAVKHEANADINWSQY
ncbi:MAG TPA: LysR family transcriptional regulator [Methylophilaceae bacterium]|nr:LysR family transcriptional regulator [Methylophilaceae bacterium]